MSLGYSLQYYVTLPLILLMQLLPRNAAHALARLNADIIFKFSPKRRKVGLENITRVFGNTLTEGEKLQLLRESFRNTAMSITDLFTIRKSRENAEKDFDIQGLEHYEACLKRQKGTVLVSSHMGSWEYLAFIFYLTQTRGSVVVKQIRNPLFDKRVDQDRQATGLHTLDKKNSIRKVLKELRKNYTVAILIDQWAGPEGIWQKFFGYYTSTTSVPARLAIQTGCALLPAFCVRTEDGKFKIMIHPPLFAENFPEEQAENIITARLNEILESVIKTYPEQWSWAHRRWKDKPNQSRTEA